MTSSSPEALVASALILAIVVMLWVSLARADECLPTKPSNQRGQYYSWRVIDKKTCWYVGRPGKPKSQLHWAVGIRYPADAPSVKPVEVVRETAVSLSLASNDLDGTFLREWCDIMSDLAAPWWRNRAEVRTWTDVLSGGH